MFRHLNVYLNSDSYVDIIGFTTYIYGSKTSPSRTL